MKKQKLVMLPGWGMDYTVWEPVSSFLFQYFEPVFCDWHDVDTVEAFKTRVFSLIEEKIEGSFWLLGWSLGSLLAIEAACKYADRVDRVILICGTSRFTRDKKSGYSCGWTQSVVEKMKAALYNDRQKTLASFYDSMFSEEEIKQGYDKKTKEFIQTGKACKLKELEAGLDFLIHEDVRGMLENINAPLLLIHGEKDTICPVSASEYISKQVKGTVFFNIMAGVGHVPFHTAANEFNTLIKVFMELGEKND